jgi:hypothetical protein
MPRIANNTDAILKDLIGRLEKLVEAARAEGRDDALAEVRDLVGGGLAKTRGRPPGTGAPTRRKSTKPRKNPWANMTDEERKARVRKMLAGRGLKPKDER